MRMTDKELKEHFAKVDKLVNYYLDNRDDELATIEEALQALFGDMEEGDLNRAIDTLNAKTRKRHNAILNLWNS